LKESSSTVQFRFVKIAGKRWVSVAQTERLSAAHCSMFVSGAAECDRDNTAELSKKEIRQDARRRNCIHQPSRPQMEVAGVIRVFDARQAANRAVRNVASNICTDAACCVSLSACADLKVSRG
jgi:hypothetical protein